MMPQTLASIVTPKSMPVRIAVPCEPSKYRSMSSPYTAMIDSPNRNVSRAAYRNHHRARKVSFRSASERAPSDSSAYAGVCTKLKKYSRPIHVIPAST
jgi:hypothetical protein